MNTHRGHNIAGCFISQGLLILLLKCFYDGTWFSLPLHGSKSCLEDWDSFLICKAYVQASKWFTTCRPRSVVHMWNLASVTYSLMTCLQILLDATKCGYLWMKRAWVCAVCVCTQHSLGAFIWTDFTLYLAIFLFPHLFLHKDYLTATYCYDSSILNVAPSSP